MATVSNTSPLLNLAILGELELIRAQFDSVFVPPAVVDEFQFETERPETTAFIRVREEDGSKQVCRAAAQQASS